MDREGDKITEQEEWGKRREKRRYKQEGRGGKGKEI
jgi:hypothetical protein